MPLHPRLTLQEVRERIESEDDTYQLRCLVWLEFALENEDKSIENYCLYHLRPILEQRYDS